MKPWGQAHELACRLRNALNELHGLNRSQLNEDEVTWRLQLARDFLTLMRADAQRLEQAWLDERGDGFK